MVGDDQKACMGCGEVKPLASYYVNKAGLAGRQSRCKPCFRRQLVATEDYRKKHNARNAVRLALKSGRMARPAACSACLTSTFVHGHHDDYAKPLDVRWLCKACHEEHHRGDTYGRHGKAVSA